MADRHAEFVADARRYSRAIWDNLNQLAALQREWNALDYGSTLVAPTGGPTATEVGSVVFATADAIEDLLATGHATNMAKLL
jgi:hypothetical protein